jgi:RNA polymerase sigma-70 factor (ECF subfamily)
VADAAEPSDEELVRRIRAGDTALTATLFDRHLVLLRAAARSRLPAALRGKVGESDVIQDAWLAAFQRLSDFEDRGEGSFRRWLRQILEHKVVDEVRRHVEAGSRDARREVRLATRADTQAGADDQTSPSMQVANAEETAAVRRAVDELPSAYAQIVRLVHQEGLTLVEAGARMGRSPDAVRKLYGRALARLAGEVDDPEDDGG